MAKVSATDIPTKTEFSRVQLIAEKELAERLGISVRTLRQWRYWGRGPRFIKLGKAVRYSVADIEAYIASNRRQSTRPTGASPKRVTA